MTQRGGRAAHESDKWIRSSLTRLVLLCYLLSSCALPAAPGPAARATAVPSATALQPAPTATLLPSPPPTVLPTPTPAKPPSPSPTVLAAPTLVTPSESERQSAIASIRMCLGQPEADVRYSQRVHPSLHPEVVIEVYEAGSFYVQVDTRTNQVLSAGPGGDLPRSGTAKPYDTTPRYTSAQLEVMARAFIARCTGANLNALTPNHTSSPTTTESVAFFFRWEDHTRIIDNSVFPFVSVGFMRSGDWLGYDSMLPFPSAPVPTVAPTTPGPSPTPRCWGSLSPMPTATPTPPRILMTRTPGLQVVFPCVSTPSNRQGWLMYTGTGINQGNRGLLDLHPNVKAPVLTLSYPPTWKQLTIPTGFGGGNQAYLDFALSKHQPGLPESRGETPAPSDAFFHFVLVLDESSPYGYDDTMPLGFGGLGMVIEHGPFNGYPAMLAYIGDTQHGLQRHVLFQASRGVLVLISVEFLIEGSDIEYVQQTLVEIDSILASVRVSPSSGSK